MGPLLDFWELLGNLWHPNVNFPKVAQKLPSGLKLLPTGFPKVTKSPKVILGKLPKAQKVISRKLI